MNPRGTKGALCLACAMTRLIHIALCWGTDPITIRKQLKVQNTRVFISLGHKRLCLSRGMHTAQRGKGPDRDTVREED